MTVAGHRSVRLSAATMSPNSTTERRLTPPAGSTGSDPRLTIKRSFSLNTLHPWPIRPSMMALRPTVARGCWRLKARRRFKPTETVQASTVREPGWWGRDDTRRLDSTALRRLRQEGRPTDRNQGVMEDCTGHTGHVLRSTSCSSSSVSGSRSTRSRRTRIKSSPRNSKWFTGSGSSSDRIIEQSRRE